MDKNLLYGLFVLLLTTFACRPVIAIGWGEFLVFILLVVILLGLPLLRFIRRAGGTQRREKKKK